MKLFSLERLKKKIAKAKFNLYSTRQVKLYTRLIQLGFVPSIESGYMDDGTQVSVLFDFSDSEIEEQVQTFFNMFGGDNTPGHLVVYYEEGGVESFSCEEIKSMENQYKYDIKVPLIK